MDFVKPRMTTVLQVGSLQKYPVALKVFGEVGIGRNMGSIWPIDLPSERPLLRFPIEVSRAASLISFTIAV